MLVNYMHYHILLALVLKIVTVLPLVGRGEAPSLFTSISVLPNCFFRTVLILRDDGLALFILHTQ